MFSRRLIKLIDEAIFPALVLFMSRLISVILIARNLNADFEILTSGIVFADKNDYIEVNSYSILAMSGIVIIGLIIIVIKSLIFHDSHIKPSLTAKLFSLRADSLIQNSFHIYSKGAVWLSYLYLMLTVSAFMAFFNILYTWVFFLILTFTIVITVLFISDIDHEIKITKSHEAEYDPDSKYMMEEENE